MLIWPGLCPGVGIMVISSVISASLAIRSAFPGIHDRLDGVIEYGDVRRLDAMVAPILIFGLAEQITRIGEGRHPFAAGEFRVPADVVDMQMRAQHCVDAVGG